MQYSLNSEFHKLINKIETQGFLSQPRGLKVKELEMERLTINPTMPLADFDARPFNWKYFMGEMAWYLKQDRNVDYINNFSSFWKNIADEEGNINSNYGHLLFGKQIQWALDSLKKDINTRQAISFISNPGVQYHGNKDFVCTIYLNFWVRNNKLNMKVQMRSNDIFYGLTFDAPFFAFVQQTMHQWLLESYPDLALGTYYHCADNIHFYERHFELAQEIIKEPLKNPNFFLLKTPLFVMKDNIMVLTVAGIKFLNEVEELIQNNPITQEQSKAVLNNYFYIQ